MKTIQYGMSIRYAGLMVVFKDLWWLQIDVKRVIDVVIDESKKFPWLNGPGPVYNCSP
jgi:hypothetical protein